MREHFYSETVCPCVPVLNKVQLFFDLLWATAVIPVNMFKRYDSVSVCSDETSPLVDVCFIVDNYRFYCHKVSWVVDTVGGNTLQSLRSTSACKCAASLLTSISSRVIARKLVREPTKKWGPGAVALVFLSRRTRAESLLSRLAPSVNFTLAQFSPICIRTVLFSSNLPWRTQKSCSCFVGSKCLKFGIYLQIKVFFLTKVIFLIILTTLSLNYVFILLGENWCS